MQDAIDAGCDPTAILNDGMIGAMAVVGENFKKEIIFVPQMLAAARAMKAGVEVLKPYLATGEAEAQERSFSVLWQATFTTSEKIWWA